ncbi:hypothetical protein PRK78_001946 [Emydomyces testavorans]|uniref:Uncharacterized protein n=1 Tax=Emydomyces testavorans TaxID=2070801 RepID=A0AAF0IHD0_9EURO|nr:hypothetical protein PRK78_001946 [Emydomyces testavorans]
MATSAKLTPLDTTCEDGAQHTSPAKDPRRVLHANTGPHEPPPDPAQFFLEFTDHLVDFMRATGKRKNLARKSRRQGALLNRAAERKFQYPSYHSQANVVKKGQMDQLSKIDQQLGLHKKKQAEFSQIFSQLVSKDEALPQMKLDIESSKSDAELALQKSQEAKDELDKIHLGSLAGSLDTAIAGLKQIGSVKQQISSLEKQLDPKVLRPQLQSLSDRMRNTNATLLGHSEQLGNISADCNLLKGKISDIENQKASSTTNVKATQPESITLSKCVEEFKETYSAQYQFVEGRVTGLQNQITVIRSDIANLSNQLEKLRELQEQKDNEIDNELQRLSLERKNTIDKLIEDHVNLKKQLEEWQNRQDMIIAMREHINAELKYNSERLSGHDVALTSLENRYNHLSSEPIVRQMVASLQEMYPYASTAQKEIEMFKKHLQDYSEHLNAISAQLRTAELTQITLRKDQEAEKSERLTMVKEMNVERNRMHGSIKDAFDRLDEVERVTSEKLAKVISESAQFLTKMEEMLAKVSENAEATDSPNAPLSLRATMPHNGDTAVPDVNSDNEEIHVTPSYTSSSHTSFRRPSNTEASLHTELPHEPEDKREEFHIRSGPSPPRPLANRKSMFQDGSPRGAYDDKERFHVRSDHSLPIAPSAFASNGGSLHRRVTMPARQPADNCPHRPADLYRPGPSPRKRRRGNSSDDWYDD